MVVADSFFFPFITGKAFFFRIVVEVALMVWLIIVVRDRSYLPQSNSLLLVTSLFTLAVLVSDFLGLSALKSIWSNFERMEGWIMIIHLWAYTVMLCGVMRDRKNWHNLFNVSLAISAIVAGHALFQYFGWAQVHQGATRLDASLGNSAYLAVYMLIHVFISIYLFFVTREKEFSSGGKLHWIYLVATVLFALIVFGTGTRGAILGLAGGGMVGAVITLIKGSGKLKIISGALIALVILAALFVYTGRNTSIVKGNDTLNRLASISWSDTKTQGRAFVWPMAMKGVFESPKTILIGVGQENFNYIFNEHYNPLMYDHEKWFDRAHSVFLDWLVAGGVVGLGLYLALYVFAFIYIIRGNFGEYSIYKKATLIGLFVAYGIHNIFVFDNLTSYVMFFMMLAFVSHIRGGREIPRLSNANINPDVANYAVTPAIVVIFVVVMTFVNILPIRANAALIKAMRSCSSGKPNPVLYEKVLDSSPYLGKQETREQTVMCSIAVISYQGTSEEYKQKFYALGARAVSEQVEDAPLDARSYFFGGIFFGSIGQYDKAIPHLEKAVELSPTKHEFLQSLGNAYINVGRIEEGLAMAKKSHDLAPTYVQAGLNYVAELAHAKKYDVLKELAEKNIEIVIHRDVISMLVNDKQFDLIIYLYKKGLEQKPDNKELLVSLAAVYIKNGNRQLAIQTIRKVIEVDPSIKEEAETLIKDIQAGKEIPIGL
jgi:tetratricopeptide (TPR) repeat protein/O-antigen ligase